MDAVTDRDAVDQIAGHYQALAALVPLHAMDSESEYDRAVSVLNLLLDADAGDARSPLSGLVDLLGSLIGDYDDRHRPASPLTPAASLRFLMDQHQLTQSDLPEVGSQGVVSEILRGKRDLNLRQIKALAARFHVPAAVFI